MKTARRGRNICDIHHSRTHLSLSSAPRGRMRLTFKPFCFEPFFCYLSNEVMSCIEYSSTTGRVVTLLCVRTCVCFCGAINAQSTFGFCSLCVTTESIQYCTVRFFSLSFRLSCSFSVLFCSLLCWNGCEMSWHANTAPFPSASQLTLTYLFTYSLTHLLYLLSATAAARQVRQSRFPTSLPSRRLNSFC